MQATWTECKRPGRLRMANATPEQAQAGMEAWRAWAQKALNAGSTRVWLGLLSAAILVGTGTRTLSKGIRARSGLETPEEVVAPSRAFPTAVAATAFNPLTIALWTVSFPAATPARATNSTAAAVGLLVGVGLATLTWYGGFATAVALVRKRIGHRLRRGIDLASVSGLIGFGGLLGHRTLHEQ